MKIIEFRGGLGNQLFEYAHWMYLKNKYPDEKNFYGYFPGRELWQHNGLEIHKRFEVELPKTSRLTNILGWLMFTLNRKILSPRNISVPFIATDMRPKDNAFIQEGYWEDCRYFDKDFRFKYRTPTLNEKSSELLDELKRLIEEGITPVAIHVRRGDYLTCDNPGFFSGICTEHYYENAISYIKKHISFPKFFFFSDDPDFVEENFNVPEKVVVNWNKGEDSFLDMYLMSQFPAVIIANSTFSFWGAQNSELNPLVLCPSRFNNLPYPSEIKREGWVVIPSA